MAQVSYGTITITDTNDIESITIEYARNQSTSTAPTSGWSTTRPEWAEGYYVWQRARIHKSGTESSSDTFGTAVCLTGSTGQTGSTGRGISSIVTTYCNYGTGTPAASYSGWQSTVPAYDSTKPNYWVKTVITYTTGSPATDTSIYKDNGITDAVSTSAEANATAADAWDKADDAQDDAQEALNLARNTNYAWWSLATEKTVGQNTFAAGSYGTFIRSEDFQNNPTNQPNIFVDANGLYLRRALTNLASFTGTALTFNNPSTGSAQLVIGANGTLQSGNYQRGSDTKFSTNGTKIDLINGDIITKYFRLSQGLENLNAGAYIHGTIEALDGKIGAGSSNYWEIGQYTDYNNTTNATMVGHGGSFIQLGDSSTWRLATNRIHTGWYATGDTVLHYPQDENNKYWDFGIHVPYSDSPAGRGSDKFIYIRTQNAANNSLQNLLYDLDDNYSTQQWEYKFWIDSNGNVHAPGFYVGNSTTPIGGGANTIAQKIINSDGTTFGKGSTTKPIYIDNNGYVQEIGYTIQTSVPSGAVFTDHITTATTTGSGNAVTSITADANGALTVTKGTTFSTTDKNVQSTEANTTKIWLVGTPTSGTRTGTLNYDSGVYITTTAGVLHATTFEGNLSGTASRATADSDGNTIKTTYLKLTGGNVTGAVTFGDSVSVDELTAGDLVVNGSASFTNNLQANTINGIAVGNNPKFTDTVTTVTVTGNGNAITSMTASNGAITATKGSTFLTSYTETDPIFVASAAHGITSNDISNWNSKTSNTGTVTSVRVQASSPLQSSVSTAQNASLNTTISFTNQNANTVLAGPTSGSTAAAPTFRKLVAADIPDISETYYLASNPNGYTTNVGTVTKVIAGTGLAIGTTAQGNFTTSGTINHTNSVTAKTAAAQSAKTLTFGDTFTLYEEKYDAQGHITGVASYNMTMPANPNTHYTANLITGASATAKANAVASTNGNVYLNLIENDTVRNAHKIVGSGTTTVTSDADGVITISSADSKTGTVTSITLTQGTGISIGNSGTAITTSGTRTISLADNYGDTKNPYASKTARYVLAAPANAAGVPSFRALTNADVGLSNVLNATQITGIGQGENGTIRVYKGENTYEDVPVEIVATESSTVASAQKLSSYGGSNKQPVYFPSTGNNAGKPVAIGYTIETSVPSGAVFTDTTYTFTSGTNGFTVTPLNGTAQTVTVTPSITNNITGSGTSGYLVKFNGANTITNGPALGTDTTKFLNNKGEWATPSGSVTGVKGNSESTYRTGQVNITKANIGLGNVDNTADANKNVLTATKFNSNRTIALTGDVTGSASGDGSSGWSISTTVEDDSHNHTVDTIVPKMTKTYTGVIATANTDAAAHMYNIKVLPTSYGGQWFIKYRVKATMAGISAANGNGAQESIVYISGMRNTYSAYRVWNNVIHTSYRPYYYHTARFASEAALSEGHKLGISFRYAYNPATAANSREVTFEILDYSGCTISFLDSFITYADFPSTNYSNVTTFDGTTQGNTMSGDRNDVNYQNRIYYLYSPAKETVYRYQILLRAADGGLIPVSSANNTFTIGKTYSAIPFDPFGEIYYYNSTTTINAASNVGNNTLYRQILADLRYGFDVDTSNHKLIGAKPVYLTARPQSNGMAVLEVAQNSIYGPIVQSLPTTEDGLIYIYLGNVYTETNPYRVELMINHPVYWYKNGAVRPYISDAVTVNSHTVDSNVPSNAVFTDTWKALSTSQAGYVSQAPNDTSKFLRGDASWAAVTKSNVGLGNVDNTADANKRVKGANITTTANAVAYYTDTAGTFGSKASANGALYATSANGALQWGTLPAAQGGTGKTTLKDACNALINALDTGSLNLTANDYVITQYVGGGTTTTTYHRRPASALRVGGLLTARKLKVALGSTTDKTFDGTADVTDIPISGTLGIGNGGTGATTAANARSNLGLGSAATYTAATSVGNNSNLPTGAAIQTYVSGVVGNYVTIAGDNEIITGTKSFNNILSMKYVAAKSGFGCEIGYNSTLDALVFSFA